LPMGQPSAGHRWDPDVQQYFAPFRYYSPTTARWLTRDPLGMVDGPNTYAYVGGRALNKPDILGVYITDVILGHGHNSSAPPGRDCGIRVCTRDIKAWYGPIIGRLTRRFQHVDLAKSDDCDSNCRKTSVKSGGTLRDGTPCSQATCDQIWRCTAETEYGNYCPLFNDCHVYKNRHLKQCCLREH